MFKEETVIVQIASKNPQRKGTPGYKSFHIVQKAGGKITYADFRKKGGRARDVRWDLEKGHVAITHFG